MIKISVVNYEVMNIHSHGRFLRFDDTWCQFDRGVQVFSGTEVKRGSSFNVTDYNVDKKKIESEIGHSVVSRIQIDENGWKYI